MTTRAKTVACVASAVLLCGCGLLPVDSPGTTGATQGADGRRQDYETCAARGAAERDRTQDLLGSDSGVNDDKDPLSPNNVAASRAQAELSRCMRAKGWPGAGP